MHICEDIFMRKCLRVCIDLCKTQLSTLACTEPNKWHRRTWDNALWRIPKFVHLHIHYSDRARDNLLRLKSTTTILLSNTYIWIWLLHTMLMCCQLFLVDGFELSYQHQTISYVPLLPLSSVSKSEWEGHIIAVFHKLLISRVFGCGMSLLKICTELFIFNLPFELWSPVLSGAQDFPVSTISRSINGTVSTVCHLSLMPLAILFTRIFTWQTFFSIEIEDPSVKPSDQVHCFMFASLRRPPSDFAQHLLNWLWTQTTLILATSFKTNQTLRCMCSLKKRILLLYYMSGWKGPGSLVLSTQTSMDSKSDGSTDVTSPARHALFFSNDAISDE